MKKIAPIIFSIAVAVIISIFLIISIFCILYFYWGNSSAVKDSISTVGSIFGGFATLGAAIIAAYLFTDWKVIENHKAKNEHITNTVTSFLDLQNLLKLQSIKIISIQTICSFPSIDFAGKIQIITTISEFQQDILFSLRSIKIHIQLFSSISDNLVLCSTFEKIINDLENEAQEKFLSTLNGVNTNTPEETMASFNEYFTHTNDKLVVDLHSKVIVELSKKIKAI